MKTDNLGRWIDELAATIEDLEKRVDAITVTPPTLPTPPAPTGYHFKCDELVAGTGIAADAVTVLESFADITGYDMILLYLNDLTDGYVGETICPVPLVTLSRSFTLTSSYKLMEYGYKYAFRFRWQRQVITGQNYDTLTFFPIPDTHANIMVSIYGLKIEADETQQNVTMLQKAAAAVKKATTRKSKKGGTKDAVK